MQSVVKGQVAITLERKINSGRKQIKQKMIHTITETNRIPQTKIYKGEISVRTYQGTYHMLNESQQKPTPRRQHDTHKKKTG